jgi:hypothetical protein
MYVHFNMQLQENNTSVQHVQESTLLHLFLLYPMIISRSLNVLEMLQFFAERL